MFVRAREDGWRPSRVGAQARYWPGVRALGTYLLSAQHLPLERTSGSMSDLGGRK